MRLPRKMKKELGKASKNWRFYTTNTKHKLHIDDVLDVIFPHDNYDLTELIINQLKI